jgi:hypothetical protein
MVIPPTGWLANIYRLVEKLNKNTQNKIFTVFLILATSKVWALY